MLTLGQVMDGLALSRQAVMRLVDRGDLPAFKIAQRYRFLPADVLAFIESRRVVARVSDGWLG